VQSTQFNTLGYFSGLPDYAHGYFSDILMGFCSNRLHECAYKI